MEQLFRQHLGTTVGLPIFFNVSQGSFSFQCHFFKSLSTAGCLGFPHSSVGKEFACNAEDLGSIPGSGRSLGEGNGNPLQYSCLENPMDRGAWQATVHGVARVRHDLAGCLNDLLSWFLFLLSAPPISATVMEFQYPICV